MELFKQDNPAEERYIRQNARNMPLGKCYISEGWEACLMATVVVTRRQKNGKFLMGTYCVDLGCLGVRGTIYATDVTMEEYKMVIKLLSDGANLKQTDYTTAHNTIQAGWDYAESLGFEQSTKFSTVTKYILQEDSDDIPIISVPCGKNGKPHYIQGEDPDITARKVLQHLREKVGTNNFTFELSDDSFIEQEDKKALLNQLKQKSNDEIIDILVSERKEGFLYNDAGELDCDRIYMAANALLERLVDEEELNAALSKWNSEYDIVKPTSRMDMPELLGLPNDTVITDEQRELLNDKDLSEPELVLLVGDLFPDAALLKYKALSKKGDVVDKHREELKQFCEIHPDYPLFKMYMKQCEYTDFVDGKLKGGKVEYPEFNEIFEGRKFLTTMEVLAYEILKSTYYVSTGVSLESVKGVYCVFKFLSDLLEGQDPEKSEMILETMKHSMSLHLLKYLIKEDSEKKKAKTGS